MLHRSRPRAKSGAPTTPRGPPGSQQLPANSGRRVSRTPPRVRGGEQLLAKSVSPPIFDDQEEPARLARPSGKAREAGDLLPLPLGCHTNRGPASQGPQEIRDGSARTPNAPHLNVALGGFGADLMLTPTADFNETRTLEGMSSPVDISPGSGTATWVSRDARLSKIPRYQEGLRKSSEGLDQPDKQEEVLRNQNFEIRLEAIEQERKRLAEALEEEREEHRQTTLMLKQVAMEHINEQRRKGELMEQLELEKATRSTRPRESEEILRRDLERRRRQVDELSEEVSDLRLRLESQAVAHNFQVETKMSVFASMQERMEAHKARAAYAEKAVAELTSHLKEIKHEAEADRHSLAAAEKARDAALAQASALQNKLATLEKKGTDELKQKVQDLTEEAFSASLESKGWKQAACDAQAKAREAQEMLDRTSKELENTRKELRDAEELPEQLSSEAASAMSMATGSEMGGLNAQEATRLREELDEALASLSAAVSQKEAARARLEVMQAERDSLQEQVAMMWSGSLAAYMGGEEEASKVGRGQGATRKKGGVGQATENSSPHASPPSDDRAPSAGPSLTPNPVFTVPASSSRGITPRGVTPNPTFDLDSLPSLPSTDDNLAESLQGLEGSLNEDVCGAAKQAEGSQEGGMEHGLQGLEVEALWEARLAEEGAARDSLILELEAVNEARAEAEAEAAGLRQQLEEALHEAFELAEGARRGCAECVSLRAEMEVLREAEASTQAKCSELRVRLDAMSAAASVDADRVEVLRVEAEEAQAEASSWAKKAAMEEKKCQRLQAEVATRNEKTGALEEELAEAKEVCKALRVEVEELLHQRIVADGHAQELEQVIDARASETRDLQMKLAGAESNLQDARNREDGLRAEAERLRGLVEEAKARVEVHEGADTLGGHMNDLRADRIVALVDRTVEAADLKWKICMEKMMPQMNAEEEQELRAELESERTARATAKTTLKETLMALREQQSAVEEQQAAMQMAEEMMNKTKGALKEALAGLRKAQREAAESREALEEERQRTAEYQEEAVALQMQLTSMTEVVCEAEKAAAEMKGELELQLDASAATRHEAEDRAADLFQRLEEAEAWRRALEGQVIEALEAVAMAQVRCEEAHEAGDAWAAQLQEGLEAAIAGEEAARSLAEALKEKLEAANTSKEVAEASLQELRRLTEETQQRLEWRCSELEKLVEVAKGAERTHCRDLREELRSAIEGADALLKAKDAELETVTDAGIALEMACKDLQERLRVKAAEAEAADGNFHDLEKQLGEERQLREAAEAKSKNVQAMLEAAESKVQELQRKLVVEAEATEAADALCNAVAELKATEARSQELERKLMLEAEASEAAESKSRELQERLAAEAKAKEAAVSQLQELQKQLAAEEEAKDAAEALCSNMKAELNAAEARSQELEKQLVLETEAKGTAEAQSRDLENQLCQSKIQELLVQITAETRAKEDAESSCSELLKQLETETERREAAEERCGILEGEVAEVGASFKKIRTQLKDVIDAKEVAEDSLAARDALITELEAVNEARADAEAEVGKLRRQLVDSNMAREAAETTCHELKQRLEKEASEMGSALQEITRQVEVTTKSNEAAMVAICDLRKQVADANQKKEAAEVAAAEKEEEAAASESSRAALLQRLAEMSATAAEAAAAEAEGRLISQAINALKGSMAMEERLGELKGENARLKVEAETLEELNELLEGERGRLEALVESMKRRLRSAESEKKALDAQVRRLEVNLGLERELVAQGNHEVAAQAQMRHGIEAQMRELAEELEMEKQGLDLASAQIEQAEGQMMVLNNKVEALEGHVRIERARVAELTEELDAERKRGSQASTAERKAICATNRLCEDAGTWLGELEVMDSNLRLLKANITQLSGATSGVSAGLCSARANVALLIEEQRGFSASAEAIRQASACRSMDLMLELEEMRAEVRQGEVELSEAQQEIQTLRRLLEDVSSFLGPVAGKERLEPSSVLSELEKVLRSYRAVMAEKCTLEENNAGLVNKIVDMEQTLKSHGSEKAALENRQAELVSRVGELEESLADLKQREENLSYTAAEVEIMKAQVEDAQKARRDAVRALQSLNASQSIGGGLSPLPRRPCRSLGNPSEARHARAAWHGAASALLSRAESGEDTPQRLVIDMSASLIAAVAVMTQLEARLADCEAALAEADDLLADAEQEAAMSRAELQTIKVLKSEAEAARIEARSNLHRLEEELRNTRISRAAAQVDLEKVQRALREAEEALHAERSTSAIDSAVTHTMVVSDRASGFTGSTRSRQRPWRISSSSSSVSMSLTGTPRGSGPTEDTTPGWYSSSSETWRTKSKGTTNRPGLKPSAVPLLQIPSGNDQGNYKAESVRSDFSIPWLPVQVSTTRRSPVSAPDRLAAGTPKPAGSGSESVNSTENMPVERSRSSSFPGNARDRKTWEVPSLLGGTVHIQTRTDSQR